MIIRKGREIDFRLWDKATYHIGELVDTENGERFYEPLCRIFKQRVLYEGFSYLSKEINCKKCQKIFMKRHPRSYIVSGN